MSGGQSVLVTGGAGFLGSYVVRDLLAAGEDVVVFDNMLTLNVLDSVVDGRDRPGLHLEQGDLGDGWRLLHLCEHHRVDRIVHLASPLTTVIRESPAAGLAAMCGGTANVFEAARVLKMRRVVWASSISVFGRQRGCVGNDLCEDLAAAYREDASVDSIGLRLTVLYGAWRLRGWGPSFGQDSDPIRSALAGEPVVVRNPELSLDWLYVEDAAALICRSLEVSRPVDHVFNTSGESATRFEFAQRIEEAIPDSEVAVERDRSDDPPGEAVTYDDGPLRSQIGYGSHHSLRDGIDAAVAAYRHTGEQAHV